MSPTPHYASDYCGGEGFKPAPDALAAGICDVCGKRVKFDWAGRIPRHLKAKERRSMNSAPEMRPVKCAACASDPEITEARWRTDHIKANAARPCWTCGDRRYEPKKRNPSSLHFGPVSKGRFFGALCGATPGDLAYITDASVVTCPACLRALAPSSAPPQRVARVGPTVRERGALRVAAVAGDRERVILLLAASRITGQGSRRIKEVLTDDVDGYWRNSVRNFLRSTRAKSQELGMTTTEVDEAIADRVAGDAKAFIRH